MMMAEGEQRVLLTIEVISFGHPDQVRYDVAKRVNKNLSLEFSKVRVYTDVQMRLPSNRDMMSTNRADWKWDEELQMHIPCCTQQVWNVVVGFSHRCGNGPLDGERLEKGDCGEHG